jgi:CysZ protein
MELLNGIRYNVRGLWFGLKSGKLLFWGLLRFTAIIVITFVSASLVLVYHQEIMDLLWAKPESLWVVWLWHLLSWLVSLILIGVAALFSYLISQILFSVLIMDHMSRITERKITGRVEEPHKVPIWRLFLYLVKQEIPRAILPIMISILLMIAGWTLVLGPILIFVSSGIAIIFLAWDNTDLIPARHLVPFRERFRILLKTIPFHLGFGLLFLVPGLNILLLSFAPVGATLYHIEKHQTASPPTVDPLSDSS